MRDAYADGNRIPIGAFYVYKTVPTFEERLPRRIPTYLEAPPALQRIDMTALQPSPRTCSSNYLANT
ncbi:MULTISPECIES: hypothetical protein [Pyrobaculum]|uniref:Uncharacterized protein n=2 Tax=Pyrobaculum arsenaticum TaxID=121277 RepID=A4WK35_PYRAR|nr:hypothetical protein [Pyrobaculum arsenaticum]ABP50752.1 hypothetical protein Pars_1181 [Pyrobaculum arsenaticum DSM 13514]MCY0891243.1 hypothetical protein [Pyrobaculum arsenaticum]NYR15532.1 hypothetical protein [Pyrobaculum arsenaticum]